MGAAVRPDVGGGGEHPERRAVQGCHGEDRQQRGGPRPGRWCRHRSTPPAARRRSASSVSRLHVERADSSDLRRR